MCKKTIAILGIVSLALVLGFVFLSQRINLQDFNTPMPGQQGGNNPTAPSEETPVIDPLKERIQAMTLEEKVGQLVMVGVDGYEINANAQQLIQNYHVGGFVLLKKNVNDTQQMLKLLNALKDTNGVNKIPLFLALDEEGGRVSRMPSEFKKMPSSLRVGAQNNGALGKRMGEILGREVKEFGMNVNFAPVLDIFSNPKNTVIGDRAFGNTPELVSKVGIQAMGGIQDQGIISVVKHFPGHGDTSVDSHVGLPRVDYDLERLRNFELVPFAEAIANDVDAIMLAHILLPKIDPDYPASFSEALISDILRKEMSYDGVVITDDMTMGAIVENYSIGEAAVKSILAGSDIVLVCHDFAKEEAVLKEILHAAETGKIPSDRIDESVYRVLKLKEKYALADRQIDSVDVQGINAEIEQLYKNYPALKG
ncbi:beta-N-acetylhexosaminidase [Desulfitobacterium sp. PCE1]|uniref:beta-N-acetylhexosaminidase n=1 Tax=Desulfitobacterium sp. PCE1 TaxID=146907 RepID=UPI00037EC79E|nr:beta-N-acetylhexosaminidase [Desulfitobacterium sp. PCE1]